MLWSYRGIEARIWPLDHCPPHVTFVSRAGNWTARVKFSVHASQVEIWDIKPLRNAPTLGLVNSLVNQVNQRLAACRLAWWTLQQDVCLDNKEVERVSPGVVRLGAAVVPVGKVIARSGTYRAESHSHADAVVVRVKWPGQEQTLEQVVE